MKNKKRIENLENRVTDLETNLPCINEGSIVIIPECNWEEKYHALLIKHEESIHKIDRISSRLVDMAVWECGKESQVNSREFFMPINYGTALLYIEHMLKSRRERIKELEQRYRKTEKDRSIAKSFITDTGSIIGFIAGCLVATLLSKIVF